MYETNTVRSGGFGLSAMALKIIAMLVMLLDHAAAVFLVGHENYLTMRTIGRISFPIYCFLIAEGMCYTRNIYRYALRLGLFALISEIPYDLVFHGSRFYPQSQNVFFTLFLAVLAGTLAQWCGFKVESKQKPSEGQSRSFLKHRNPPVLAVIAILVSWAFLLWLGDFLHTDYGTKGVALILIFYVGRRIYHQKKMRLAEKNWDLEFLLLLPAAAFMYLCWRGKLQLYALAALPFLLLYNGSKGTPLPKYLFYCFYPLHLLFLYFLHTGMAV